MGSAKTEDALDEDNLWLSAIEVAAVGQDNSQKRVTARMNVNNCEVVFQLDSAADVNTICQRYVKKEQVRPTTQNLIMWNKSNVKPLGEVVLCVTNPKNGEESEVTFTVVSNKLSCLLGLSTVRKMGLITINDERFISAVKDDSQLGDLGEVTVTVWYYFIVRRTTSIFTLTYSMRTDTYSLSLYT